MIVLPVGSPAIPLYYLDCNIARDGVGTSLGTSENPLTPYFDGPGVKTKQSKMRSRAASLLLSAGDSQRKNVTWALFSSDNNKNKSSEQDLGLNL